MDNRVAWRHCGSVHGEGQRDWWGVPWLGFSFSICFSSNSEMWRGINQDNEWLVFSTCYVAWVWLCFPRDTQQEFFIRDTVCEFGLYLPVSYKTIKMITETNSHNNCKINSIINKVIIRSSHQNMHLTIWKGIWLLTYKISFLIIRIMSPNPTWLNYNWPL